MFLWWLHQSRGFDSSVFEDAHRDRFYERALIGVIVRALWASCVVPCNLKKKSNTYVRCNGRQRISNTHGKWGYQHRTIEPIFVLSFPVVEPPLGTCAIAWAHRQNKGENCSCSIENIISFFINIFCTMRIAPASKFSGSTTDLSFKFLKL